MKSLMIQGTSSGAGKTTLVAALCRIFSDKGYSVAPFKSQNMSNFAYITPDFEISRAQAIQAFGARCDITPDLNPILLKPVGNYSSIVYLNGKRFKKMHAREYYEKFVNTEGMKIASKSLRTLQKNFDLVIMEGAGSPAEINLQKYDIANMKMAKKANANVLLVTDIDRGGSFASLAGTMALIQKQYQKLVHYIQRTLIYKNHQTVLIRPKIKGVVTGNDAYYQAKGRYSLFFTCNSWINSGLKTAEQNASFWTAFASGIFYQYGK